MVAFSVSLVTRLLNIGNVCGAKELFQLGQLVGAGEAERESCVNRGLTESLAGHAEVLDKVLVLAGVSRGLNDFVVVRGILSLDVRLDGVSDTETIKLGLGDLAPDLRSIDLIGILLSTINGNNLRRRISKMLTCDKEHSVGSASSPERLL